MFKTATPKRYGVRNVVNVDDIYQLNELLSHVKPRAMLHVIAKQI